MKYSLFVLLMPLIITINFKFELEGYKTQCFYEYLQNQGKYNVELQPQGQGQFEFTVSTSGKTAQVIYKKTSETVGQRVQLSKFATQTTTYNFCVRSLQVSNVMYYFKLQSGIDLMELEVLPDLKDNQYLDREVKLLETHQQNIFNSLESVETSKAYTQTMFNLMSTKTVGFGILGFIVIIVVNIAFYKEIKKTLKERKLI